MIGMVGRPPRCNVAHTFVIHAVLLVIGQVYLNMQVSLLSDADNSEESWSKFPLCKCCIFKVNAFRVGILNPVSSPAHVREEGTMKWTRGDGWLNSG
jgi:hypothetical protein